MASSQKYLLKSNFDDTIFEVDEKVINSSILLKNIIELTEINPTVPIGVDCSCNSLKKFINLIHIQDSYGNDEEKYNLQVIELFQDFSDDVLADFINETCIIDSDVLLDALADIILAKIKDMSPEEMNKYFEIENDFTVTEREWQRKNLLEYFISLNDPSFPLQFPLQSSQSFYSMKIKFSSPLNILLSRICQRSNEIIAFRLSLCSKLLKNECDRYPIKVSRMCITYYSWRFEISNENQTKWQIRVKKENEIYFSAICTRRTLAWNDNFLAMYSCATFLESQYNIFKKFNSFSLEWMIPHKNINAIKVSFDNFEILVSSFDITKFHYSNIFFDFTFADGIDFDFVYNQLIEKDLSKEVKLHFFNFSQRLSLSIYKKPNAAKFYKCYTRLFPNNIKKTLPQKFINFLKNHMESNGQYEFTFYDPIIPEKIVRTCPINPRNKYCIVSDLLDNIYDQ